MFKDVEIDNNYHLNKIKDMVDYFFSLYKQWSSSHQDCVFSQFGKFVNDVNLNIIEPEVQASKGRPKGSKSSTRRDPSAFETLEKKKCGIIQVLIIIINLSRRVATKLL